MSYIVAYMIGRDLESSKDHYIVFCDGEDEDNKQEATEFYVSLLSDPKVYSANLCKLLATTDHYPVTEPPLTYTRTL